VFFLSGCKTPGILYRSNNIELIEIKPSEVLLRSSASNVDITEILNKYLNDSSIKTFRISDGQFLISKHIRVARDSITILGSRKTVIKSSFPNLQQYNLMFLNESHDPSGTLNSIVYKSLIFDASNFGFLVINQFNRVKNIEVSNCQFLNGGNTFPDNSNNTSMWTNALACSNKCSGIISNNRVLNMTKTGIYIAGGNEQMIVADNYIDMNNNGFGRPGILALKNTIVYGNEISNCSGAGILLQSIEPTDLLVSLGIDVRPYNIKVFRNKINKCFTGIEFNHFPGYDTNISIRQGLDPRLSNSVIEDNVITNVVQTGIMIVNRKGIKIRNNNIRNEENNPSISGITILGSEDIEVTQNYIDNVYQNIFFIENVSKITISGNKANVSLISPIYELEMRSTDYTSQEIYYKSNSFKSTAFTNTTFYSLKNSMVERN